MTSNLLPVHLLSPGANLEAYVQAVSAIPLLTPEEEKELGRRYFYENDLDAARSLVLAHLRYVVHVARSYSGYGLPEADLIQEGNVGLMKAVKRFDPEYGVRLVSFAIHWIKAEIHEFVLKNWRIVKVATTKAQRKLFFNLRSARQGIGWMSADEVVRVAKELGVDENSVRQMESRMSSRDESWDPVPQDNEEHLAIPWHQRDVDSDPAQQIEESSSMKYQLSQLEEAVENLEERSRDIIFQRWLSEEKATLHDLADKYGVSAERIRQLEQNALKKLKSLIPLD